MEASAGQTAMNTLLLMYRYLVLLAVRLVSAALNIALAWRILCRHHRRPFVIFHSTYSVSISMSLFTVQQAIALAFSAFPKTKIS